LPRLSAACHLLSRLLRFQNQLFLKHVRQAANVVHYIKKDVGSKYWHRKKNLRLLGALLHRPDTNTPTRCEAASL